MPIFEFTCGKCGKDSELLVRSSTWKGAACPKCGSKRLRKKFSTFASRGTKPAGGSKGGKKSCGSCKGGCGCC